MSSEALIPDKWETVLKTLLKKPVEWAVMAGLSPAFFSLSGVVLALVSGLMFSFGYHYIAGILYLLSGLCDVLDGQIARASGHTTRWGAFLDSTLDRISEILVFTGILIYAYQWSGLFQILSIWLAMISSLLVSYVKARAEGLGSTCKTGWAQRPERVLLIGLAALTGGTWGTSIAVVVVAILATVTVFQRIQHIYTTIRDEKNIGNN